MCSAKDTAEPCPLSGEGPSTARIALSAGALTAEFEPETGFLRYLRFAEHELVRGIYVAVRDQNWGTVKPHFSQFNARCESDHFEISFVAECRKEEICFHWQGQLLGTPEGRVTFRFSGQASSDFLSNRIGFCVLHPVTNLAGKSCRVEHVDGTTKEGVFPDLISPHQPFQAIRALTHAVTPGLDVEVRMTGDTFEMEDQRNWSDGSYKTYCRPLGLPFPFSVAARDRFEQAVEVRLIGTARPAMRTQSEPPIRLEMTGDGGRVPAVGLGMAPDAAPLSAMGQDLLRLMKPAHLRVDLDCGQPVCLEQLERAAIEATACDTSLELALHITDSAESELRTLGSKLRRLCCRIVRVHLFHVREWSTSARWGQIARKCLRPSIPDVPIGLGTDSFFAELNRERPDPAVADFISYSINPQGHATDEASIVESLEGQRMTAVSACDFSAGRSVVVSPVTLRMRFNPYITLQTPPTRLEQLVASTDPRQQSLFVAAWTAGSLRALAAGGAASITYYETSGPRGVLDDRAGLVYPVYHPLADLCAWRDAEFVAFRSSRPLSVQGIAMRNAERHCLVLANLELREHTVCCLGVPANSRWRLRTLEAATINEAKSRPQYFRDHATKSVTASYAGELELSLSPYAVLTLDSSECDRA